MTNNILQSIKHALKLPDCNKKFPRDIDRQRPCLNYQMNLCAGWCRHEMSAEQYRRTVMQVKQLLCGNYKSAINSIRIQMNLASENLNFELAATLRDQIAAIEALGRKQLVTAGSFADTDVIGYAQNDTKSCFAVLHFSNGNLIDKEYKILSVFDDAEATVCELLKQYYLSSGIIPANILLPFDVIDRHLLVQLIEQNFKRKTKINVPIRGDKIKLIDLANKNAQEELNRITDRNEQVNRTITLLGRMLAIDPPKRIEAFDISNISGTDIVAGMVVFVDGKPQKNQYRRFKVTGLQIQDDYASMHQVVIRRFTNLKCAQKGFEQKPDLILIDGGVTHAKTAADALETLELNIKVFGMVKDSRHRTRALVTPEGNIIQIDHQQSIFSFIGSIQEETHRFAITFHRQQRSKRLKYSELDTIQGVGEKRKQELLKKFKSLSAIRDAGMDELEQVVPATVAKAIYRHFRNIKEGQV